MELRKFWNKAIEFYCTYDSPDRLKSFDTVFIAISEESLTRVYEKYSKAGSLTNQEIELLNKNIERVGGIIDSYYVGVKDIHNDFNSPAKYSFLRFSILVIGAFRQDSNPLRNFWSDFDSFLKGKGIKVIPKGNFRTEYLQSIISNLSKLCAIKHDKTFFDVNVFGENSIIINVGKIKAHSIFQGRSLTYIKKAIYNLGYSDSHNIEDLTFQDLEYILVDSGRTRILNLFRRDNETKEIVLICLQIWLKNWRPQQEEKVKLLGGQSPSKKSKLPILRIWTINSNNKIELKYGFIYRFELGEDSFYYLSEDDNVYVDASWGIKLNDSRILYIIYNYTEKSDLSSNILGLEFTKCDMELTESEYALEKIPHRNYFLELKEKSIKININPILLASKYDVDNENVVYFHEFSIANQENIGFKLYRINDLYECTKFSFFKINNLEITPVGISDGRSGAKSFLSSFPIIIKHYNLIKGIIHLVCNDNIVKKIELQPKSNDLHTETEVGLLIPGVYSIKYFDENGKCLLFMNGKQTVDFEIVESGSGDRRNELTIDSVPTFYFHEFRRLKEIKNIEDSFLILHDYNSELKFEDKHTYFYFVKNNRDEWEIKPNKQCFFIQRLKEKPNNFNELYSRYQPDFEYLSKNFVKYDYKVSFCERPETINLSFNINDFYQRNEEHRININKVMINCYYFRLESFDDKLKEKYPSVEVGDVIYFISNKFDSKPENFIKLINQEVFPFKK